MDRVANIMRTEWLAGRAPTKLTYEGVFIASLRAQLCFAGWRYWPADVTARDVVTAALDRIGAKRPDWDEGQPQPEDRFIERTRCVRCHHRLPDGHQKFCSALCGDAHRVAVRRAREEADERVGGELAA